MDSELVVLVDEDDNELGQSTKLEVHQKGLLHRAFSIFIFNPAGQMLIHRRAAGKYHSGGLWTNACCSHPAPGENLMQAARHRLQQEMGLSCSLTPAFHFRYRAELDRGLIEHELDHVFTGVAEQDPIPDPNEVQDWKYCDLPDLIEDIKTHPDRYSEWFKICVSQYRTNLRPG